MAPNLVVAAHTMCTPHRWFTKSKTPRVELNRIELWSSPVPGIYQHKPGCGWSLIAVKDTDEFEELSQPLKVTYSHVLHRYLLAEDYADRKREGTLPTQKRPATFFRLDDGVTWVQCYDREGNFVPGPYRRYVVDESTGEFRVMLRGDDPEWSEERRASGQSATSALSSLHTSPVHSSRNSIDDRRSRSSSSRGSSAGASSRSSSRLR